MKRILIMVFVAMVAMGTYAQAKNLQCRQKGFPSEEMIKALNLSQDQVAKLKSADADFKAKKREEMQKIKQEEKARKINRKDARLNDKRERLNIIKNNLSSQQYVSFLEFEFLHSKNGRPMMKRGKMMGKRPMNHPQKRIRK